MVVMADPQNQEFPDLSEAKLNIDYVCAGFLIDGV
jgi:hypothetical protein